MAFKWIVDPKDVFPQGMESYTQAIFARIVAVAEKNAKVATAWMKANHPWQNETGKAEAGLTVTVEAQPVNRVEMIFHYGPDVPYDKYLELSRAGVWGILAPAVDVFGPQVMRDLKDVASVNGTK